MFLVLMAVVMCMAMAVLFVGMAMLMSMGVIRLWILDNNFIYNWRFAAVELSVANGRLCCLINAWIFYFVFRVVSMIILWWAPDVSILKYLLMFMVMMSVTFPLWARRVMMGMTMIMITFIKLDSFFNVIETFLELFEFMIISSLFSSFHQLVMVCSIFEDAKQVLINESNLLTYLHVMLIEKFIHWK